MNINARGQVPSKINLSLFGSFTYFMFTWFLSSSNHDRKYRSFFYGKHIYSPFCRNNYVLLSFCCRLTRLHNGYDIVCSAGATVYAPFPATVRGDSIPYSPRSSHWGADYNTGVFMEGTGSWTGGKFISVSSVQKVKNS